MIHLDLFAGIGGFSIASDTVFGDVEHIFVEWDGFCQKVLHKHWPEAPIYGDIRQFNSDTLNEGLEGRQQKQALEQRGQLNRDRQNKAQRPFILTGGFPCQPFSAAGLRRGTADNRHLWPEMLRVIRLTQPTWVIAENVRGLLTWNEGLVFEQVCTDLEAAGYEVQPFVIPAVAVNAPHRRDRVWFVGHAIDGGQGRAQRRGDGAQDSLPEVGRQEDRPTGRPERADSDRGFDPHDWEQDWAEVAAELCSVDDGLPVALGGFELSKPQHRKEQLKAYGNAIVPQVAIEIMKGMLI